MKKKSTISTSNTAYKEDFLTQKHEFTEQQILSLEFQTNIIQQPSASTISVSGASVGG